jgi:hypothetical protein
VTGVDHRILRLNAVRQGTWKKQQLTFGTGRVLKGDKSPVRDEEK